MESVRVLFCSKMPHTCDLKKNKTKKPPVYLALEAKKNSFPACLCNRKLKMELWNITSRIQLYLLYTFKKKPQNNTGKVPWNDTNTQKEKSPQLPFESEKSFI